MQTKIFRCLKSVGNCLIDFLYPCRCAACGKELRKCELLLCTDCIGQLPYSGCEDIPSNPVFLNLAGRIPIEYAIAVFEFKKQGILQNLLHRLKYEDRPDIGRFLGRIAGERLSACRLASPDYIVPVPLHPKKQRKRGYNQSHCIAQGILLAFPHAKIADRLVLKTEQTPSQTQKNRIARWENVKDSFSLQEGAEKDTSLHGRHFLIVDDVVTTGATIEGCARKLLQIPGARLSVAAMASPL